MTTYTATLTDQYYGPLGSSGHQVTTFNMFYPSESVWGPMPVGGWPVVALTNYQGSTEVSMSETITPINYLAHELLENGFAVAVFLVPVVRGTGHGGAPVDQSTLPFNPAAGQFGPAYNGNGIIPAVDPFEGFTANWPVTNYSNNPTHPMLDDTWLCATKASQWIVQHLRFEGLDGTSGNNKYLINRNRITVFGDSSGAYAVSWPTLAPDMSILGTEGTQSAESSRPNASAMANPQFNHFMFKNTVDSFQFANTTGSPTEDADADINSLTYADSKDTSGSGDQRLNGLYGIWFQSGLFFGTQNSFSLGIKQTNQDMPMWIHCNAPIDEDVILDPVVQANPVEALKPNYGAISAGTEEEAHSLLNGLAAKYQWGAKGNVRLGATETAAVIPESPDIFEGLAEVDYTADGNDKWDDLVTWLVGEMGYPQPENVSQDTSKSSDYHPTHQKKAGTFAYTTVQYLRDQGLPTSISDDDALQKIYEVGDIINRATAQYFVPCETLEKASVRVGVKPYGTGSIGRNYGRRGTYRCHASNLIPILRADQIQTRQGGSRTTLKSSDYFIDDRHIILEEPLSMIENPYRDRYTGFPRGIRNVEITGVFGWVDNHKEYATTVLNEVSDGDTEVSVYDVSGLEIGDVVILRSGEAVETFGARVIVAGFSTDPGKTNTFLCDPVRLTYGQTIPVGSTAICYGSVPWAVQAATAVLVKHYSSGFASDDYEANAFKNRLIKERTDNYMYEKDKAKDLGGGAGFSSTGNDLADQLLADYHAPLYMTGV